MWLFRRKQILCDGVLDAFIKGDRIVLAFESAQLSLPQDTARMTHALLAELFAKSPPVADTDHDR